MMVIAVPAASAKSMRTRPANASTAAVSMAATVVVMEVNARNSAPAPASIGCSIRRWSVRGSEKLADRAEHRPSPLPGLLAEQPSVQDGGELLWRIELDEV